MPYPVIEQLTDSPVCCDTLHRVLLPRVGVHSIKNAQSARFKDMSKIACERKLLLTGTPVQNNLAELLSLLQFMMRDIFSGEYEVRALPA